MIDIVSSSIGVTLVGAGNPLSRDVEEALRLAPTLVAADGGAAACLDAGHVPEAVIGDFDSLDQGLSGELADARMIRVEEQETTDFEKALARTRAPIVLATGFTGGRQDHALAVWSVLARGVGPPTIVIGAEDVVFTLTGEITLNVAAGTRVSLFPMRRVAGRSEGLEWPIEGLTLDPMGRIGTSNRATGPVSVAMEGPGCLMLLPRTCLGAAVAALRPEGPRGSG